MKLKRFSVVNSYKDRIKTAQDLVDVLDEFAAGNGISKKHYDKFTEDYPTSRSISALINKFDKDEKVNSDYIGSTTYGNFLKDPGIRDAIYRLKTYKSRSELGDPMSSGWSVVDFSIDMFKEYLPSKLNPKLKLKGSESDYGSTDDLVLVYQDDKVPATELPTDYSVLDFSWYAIYEALKKKLPKVKLNVPGYK